ncbi:type II toxin-antitoxin system RatA family toxin [Saccharophagus sp. K07]|uniref:type II toxin-antitoxin system RatA family toxin n=1 Tax=Saccharophagus sp. K07 TaxID=2283636 RepID=UPI001652AE74|nr:type II toxin-antitoxin system RatA family toxin [Saccharophagus sp. K07]
MSKVIQCSALVPYTAQQMFDLVNDIEAYPSYMNGCAGAKVLQRGDNSITARLDLEKAGLRQSFTTRNTLRTPSSITMDLVEGPFKKLKGLWQFKEMASGSCQIEFRLEFEFANFLLGLAAGKLMSQLVNDQVGAVCRRAQALYGKKN